MGCNRFTRNLVNGVSCFLGVDVLLVFQSQALRLDQWVISPGPFNDSVDNTVVMTCCDKDVAGRVAETTCHK